MYQRNDETLQDSQSQISAVGIEVFGVKDRVEFCKNDKKIRKCENSGNDAGMTFSDYKAFLTFSFRGFFVFYCKLNTATWKKINQAS